VLKRQEIFYILPIHFRIGRCYHMLDGRIENYQQIDAFAIIIDDRDAAYEGAHTN
jgi:hypothetical protein